MTISFVLAAEGRERYEDVKKKMRRCDEEKDAKTRGIFGGYGLCSEEDLERSMPDFIVIASVKGEL